MTQLYKVSHNNNIIYIRANSWFEIFHALFTEAKIKEKAFRGASIMPVKNNIPALCAKQAGFPEF